MFKNKLAKKFRPAIKHMNIMKKILYLLLLLFGITIQAQVVTIPDTNFKAKLLEASPATEIAEDSNGNFITIDTNSDGEIQESEALTVFKLHLYNSGIADISGIAAFENLTYLECSSNLLTELDLSNNPNIEDLWITNNPFEYVNVKNGSAFHPDLIGTGNWEEIWGNLPNNTYVCADEFELEDIQPFLNIWGSTGKHVSSYCTFYPGGDYNTITGTLLFDVNGDAQCNGDDLPQPFIKINITDGVDQNSSFADESGNYIFYTQDGTYTLTPQIENPDFFTITPPDATVNFPLVNNSTEYADFCITANGIHPDLEVVIAPIMPARPGFEATYHIVYRNKGNQIVSQEDGINFLFQDDFMNFVESSQTPNNQSFGVLSWDYEDLMPFEQRTILVKMDINGPDHPDFPVNIDDVLTFSAQILPEAGDENPEDNTYIFEQTVVGSFDPNDIICVEGEVVTVENIGEELHYLIRFENTGTFMAENIVIAMDIDPEQYVVSSLMLLESSHSVNARVVGNTAEFFFNEINLDTGGHGNILLVMQTNNTLVEGSSVVCKADIYFDYNFPITTNEAITVFEGFANIEDNTDGIDILLYPNPVNDYIDITSKEIINSIEWYDALGRLVRVSLVNDYEGTFNISSYKAGIYYAKVYTGQTIKTYKVIKK